jgi:preprotein translocase subunit SecD
MIESLNARLATVAAVFLIAVAWTIPNFVNLEKIWWPTKDKMVLGLDIQGGSHLVLRVDVDSAVKQSVVRTAAGIEAEMKAKSLAVKSASVVDPQIGAIGIELEKPEALAPARKLLEEEYARDYRIDEASGQRIVISYNELSMREFKDRLLDQAIATIRNRIDEFGVAEPSITKQGTDRILVQLPGIQDATNAKELINKTARLDFMMVETSKTEVELEKLIEEAEKAGNFKLAGMKYSAYVDKLNEQLKGKLPENTYLYFEKPEQAATMEVARRAYLLKTNEGVTGDHLTDAFVGIDQQGSGAPVVNFRFDAVGARLFGDLTKHNVRKQMAIVLDKVVKSAPVINGPITGGSGVITLGGGRDPKGVMNEAKIISMALKAGALPATLEQLEERTVGPSLGADAIAKGRLAALVAAIAVFIFMGFYYKSFGVIADLSLAFNVLITMAVLSSLGATLTLPGVAGLALTVGIAVDANVIIYERIKEEMHKGSTLLAAIREGYDRAFSSIFDANVTSIAVCVVLMYFGSGPVRGFAVTLLCGLVTTMFTAVFFTRAMVDLLATRWKINLSVR